MVHDRIVCDPAIMMGKPTIKGTRITVEHVLRELGAGLAIDQLLREHPGLTEEDLRAAQAYAADYLAGDEERYG